MPSQDAIKALIEERFDAMNSSPQPPSPGTMPTPPLIPTLHDEKVRPSPKREHAAMNGYADSYEGARNAELKPAKVGGGSCAFMFESCLMVGVTDWGLKTCSKVQEEYSQHSWGGVKVHWKRPAGAKADGHLLK